MKLRAFIYTVLFSVSTGLFIYTQIYVSSVKNEEEKNKERFYNKNKDKTNNALSRLERLNNDHEFELSLLDAIQTKEYNSKRGNISSDEMQKLLENHLEKRIKLMDSHWNKSDAILSEMPRYKENEEILKNLRLNRKILIILFCIIIFSAIKSFKSFSRLTDNKLEDDHQ